MTIAGLASCESARARAHAIAYSTGACCSSRERERARACLPRMECFSQLRTIGPGSGRVLSCPPRTPERSSAAVSADSPQPGERHRGSSASQTQSSSSLSRACPLTHTHHRLVNRQFARCGYGVCACACVQPASFKRLTGQRCGPSAPERALSSAFPCSGPPSRSAPLAGAVYNTDHSSPCPLQDRCHHQTSYRH